jgi:hypothetical protein
MAASKLLLLDRWPSPVEGAALEMLYSRKAVLGSNPSLSATVLSPIGTTTVVRGSVVADLDSCNLPISQRAKKRSAFDQANAGWIAFRMMTPTNATTSNGDAYPRTLFHRSIIGACRKNRVSAATPAR